MADQKVTELDAVVTATADDLLYLVDGATTSKKITFANFEGAVDHDNLTNTHNLTTDIDHDSLTNTHNLTTDIDHDQLTNYASNEHFTEASINHTAITNIGTNSHAAIDTHIASSSIHFAVGSISHTAITDVGTNTHAQIDTHIASTAIHFTLADSIMGVQVHAADGTVSRALLFDVVTWIGSTEPLYATDNDLWVDTS